MKKKRLISLLSISLTLGLGVFMNSTSNIEVKADDTKTANIFGVQLRKDNKSTDGGYLVVNMFEYANVTANTIVSNTTQYNTADKIKVYLENDSEAVYANEFVTNYWTQNLWTSRGLMLKIPETNWTTYNGSSVYKIVLEKGLELPCGNDLYVSDKALTYINPNHKNNSYYYENFTFEDDGSSKYADPTNTIEKDITCAQIRGDENDTTVRYFVFQHDLFTGTNPSIIFDGRKYNTLSKIFIYLSKTSEPVCIADLVTATEWRANIWESHGLMIPVSDEIYQTYNGRDSFKFVIKAGCEIPVNDADIIVTKTDCAFVNSNYQEQSAYFSGYYFTPYPTDILDLGVCKITDVNFRSSDNLANCLFLMKLDFSFQSFNTVTSWAKDLNLLDNILITTKEDGVENTQPLRDICLGNIRLYLYGEPNAIGFDITGNDIYYCKYLYKVTIKKGTQIPLTADEISGYCSTTKEVEYFNNDYNKTGKIPDQYDENNKPRLYEEWCNNWYCNNKITFNVVGLDKSFEDFYYTNEMYFDLTPYQVEGYDLEITTDDGDSVYGGIYLTASDGGYNLTLTYTPASKSNSTGCGGTIISSSLIIMTLSLLGMSILLCKKGVRKYEN